VIAGRRTTIQRTEAFLKTGSVVDEANRNYQWSDAAIRAQLDRILGHQEFHATEKMRAFLRFVVEETLEGREHQLKGFTIATEVFGRDPDFDPAHDPVVRIQAGRLRRAMERYYLVAGSQDPICIGIPKGSYVPQFTAVPAATPGPRPVHEPGTGSHPEAWPTVVVLPFEDLTGNSDLAYLGPGLATELCIELGRCDDLRVMLYQPPLASNQGVLPEPDFTVQGSIRADSFTVKVVVQLIETRTGEQLWADWLKSSLDAGELISFQEKTANQIVAHLAGEHGAIPRALSSETSKGPLTIYQAVLKGYAYHQTINAETCLQAFESLQIARSQDVECGLVCSMLAMLFADNIALEFFDPERTPLSEALRMAQEGALVLPDSQLSRLALVRTHLLANDLEMALSELETAHALHPESLLFMDVIGYGLLLVGQWERGEQLVRRAIRQNPFHRVYTRFGTWLNCFRQQDYTGALEEAESLLGVGFFWDPLCRAATLGQLGRPGRGRRAVNELLSLKPDFPDRGRYLIGHYVKFPEITERVVEGLAVSGLQLASD